MKGFLGILTVNNKATLNEIGAYYEIPGDNGSKD